MPSSSGVTETLLEAFGRMPGLVDDVLDGMTDDDLVYRADPGANTIAWLVWHTARMQDAQVAAAQRVLGRAQDEVWVSDGFAGRFGLGFDERETGYGFTPDEVARVNAHAPLLKAYHQAVHDRTVALLGSLADDDYRTVVDRHWDPPVTLLARLVSIEQDAAQHLGQAAFVRGLVERRT